jgi:predicted dehydrogenase
MERFRRDGGPALSAAVAGLGYWGPNVLRGLLEQPGVQISDICDLDEERLGTVARQYPAAKPTSRYEDLLEDPRLDAIVIATPVFSHFGLASASLRAGKHTFVEKPLALGGAGK